MKKLFRLLAISFFTLLTGIGLLGSHINAVTPVYAAEEVSVPQYSLVQRALGEKPTDTDVAEVTTYLSKEVHLLADSFKVQIKELGGKSTVRINGLYISDPKNIFDEKDGSDIEVNENHYHIQFTTLKWIGDSNIRASSDTTGKVIEIIGDGVTSSGRVSCTLFVTFSKYTDYDEGAMTQSISIPGIDLAYDYISVSVTRSFWQTVGNLLSNSTVFILIATACVTIIGRSAIKIFRFGVNYKSNFATVEQQEKFESSMRQELRANKAETQDAVLKICLREINRETRPLKDIQEMAEKLRTDREILDIKLNSIDQKYNEIRKLSENINQLEQKVNRLQYGEGTTEVRRSGK